MQNLHKIDFCDFADKAVDFERKTCYNKNKECKVNFMECRFNITGFCNPQKHDMINPNNRLSAIKKQFE